LSLTLREEFRIRIFKNRTIGPRGMRMGAEKALQWRIS